MSAHSLERPLLSPPPFSTLVLADRRPDHRPKSPCPLHLVAFWLLLAPGAAALAAPAVDLHRLCDPSTPFTVVGLDSQSGRLLLSIPNPQPAVFGEAAGLFVELMPGRDVATFVAADDRGRTGGSFGPGPIVSGVPCGADCLQVERWADSGKGTWEPVGEQLPLGATMSFAATYDRGGALWILLQQLGGQLGPAGAANEPIGWAYRWFNREWHEAGRVATFAMAAPPLQPAPDLANAVVAGGALFSPAAPPAYWIKSLPAAPEPRRGQLIALAGGAAGYFGVDGNLYQTPDAGGSWAQLVWTPWRTGPVQVWQRGVDYSTDLAGGIRDAFTVVWFDQRDAADPRVWVSAWQPGAASPEVLFNAPGAISTDTGETLPVVEVIERRPREWVLLSGCVSTPGGAGVALRTVIEGAVSPPTLLLLRPAPHT